MINAVKTILGALGGFTAGAIAGVLFAPEQDPKTQGYLEVEDVHVRPRIARSDETLEIKAIPLSYIVRSPETLFIGGKKTDEAPKNNFFSSDADG
jgi:gas vesicle protein